MGCYEEFMWNLKRIVLLESEQACEAWKKLEDMEQDSRYTEYCSMNNLRTVLNLSITLKNIQELPKLLMWFSKFPKTDTTSNPISDDIAICLKNNIDLLKRYKILPEIIEVIKENHSIYLPKTSNHTNFCKAVVELLSWLPEDYDKKDIEIIKECLIYICENDYSNENMAVICFSTMCETLLKTTRSDMDLPSSALIIVFQLVDSNLWQENMKIAVAKIINTADVNKIVKLLHYFCCWLPYAALKDKDNMAYLSAWLTLFMTSLESMDNIDYNKRNQIPIRLADAIFPEAVFESCLLVADFFEIDPDENIMFYLITKVGSLFVFHELVEHFMVAIEKANGNKKFIESLVQCIVIFAQRFNHEFSSCPKCQPLCNLWRLIDDIKSTELTFLKPKKSTNLAMEVSYPSTSTGRGRRDTDRCGLVNLGNTCYMNSVLQALFMTRQFCWEVLLYKTTNDLSEQTILKHLQSLFALLKYSAKSSLAANRILCHLRPAYFTPGQQQDSSEFLCYLLDVLYEQEKSALIQSGSTDSSHGNKLKVKEEEIKEEEMMETEDVTTESSSHMQEDGSTGNMTRWITEENLSEAESSSALERKTRSLADFTQGEELSQTQNGLSDSHSDSTDSGIQSVGGEDSTSSSASTTSSPMSSSSSTSLVQKVFGGELRIIYQCHECHTESQNTDRFRDLQLCFLENLEPHAAIKVQELIDSNYFMPEELTGDNKYRCDKCGGLRDAQRRIKILQAPGHLILTLKHFRYDNQSLLRTKLRRKVIYDDTIRLPVLDQDNATYDLYAAVVHFGDSMDYGHYVAYACDAKSKWYRFNDSLVTETTLEDFKDLEAPDTPYILFYKKRTDTPEPDIPQLTSLSKNLQELVDQEKLSDNHRMTRRSLANSSLVRYSPPDDDNDDNHDNPPSNNLPNAPIVKP